MKHEYHQALKRVEDGEDILEHNGVRVKGEYTKYPRDSKKRHNDCCRLGSGPDLLGSRLQLHVTSSHQISQNEYQHGCVTL